MVINVNTDRERKTGFDWSSFQAELGDIGVSSNSDPSAGDGDGDGDSGSSVTGNVARITGSALTLSAGGGDINISGLFNLLSTYGNTNTNQDVSLKTISKIFIFEYAFSGYTFNEYVSDSFITIGKLIFQSREESCSTNNESK